LSGEHEASWELFFSLPPPPPPFSPLSPRAPPLYDGLRNRRPDGSALAQSGRLVSFREPYRLAQPSCRIQESNWRANGLTNGACCTRKCLHELSCMLSQLQARLKLKPELQSLSESKITSTRLSAERDASRPTVVGPFELKRREFHWLAGCPSKWLPASGVNFPLEVNISHSKAKSDGRWLVWPNGPEGERAKVEAAGRPPASLLTSGRHWRKLSTLCAPLPCWPSSWRAATLKPLATTSPAS